MTQRMEKGAAKKKKLDTGSGAQEYPQAYLDQTHLDKLGLMKICNPNLRGSVENK